MSKSKIPRRNELLKDYKLLDSMSKELAMHRKNIQSIVKRVSKRSRTDLTYEISDSLEDIMEHMEKAQMELDRAKEDIKLI